MTDRTWALGEEYSVGDPYLLVFYRWGFCINFDMRASYPHWTKHAEKMAQRGAVIRALEQEGISIW